ncbi:sulfite exporter TauE/SafE family protein [Massilia arenosa]|uniref:Probable membrane transporter protein n=1 Tax=Zemynaea arenosa TaxID=2561931 RepID=A0A4Y9SKT9_9BURK|nr:sulfite exporter TauE/SafE family protein [Massilia arenosa]TFW23593.1 sulfite exporter TauE/SafE family protein [Massilia arenosa]
MFLLIFLAGLWAGIQNTLAGGGSFVTLPALIVSGMSPLAANITSTVALFPGQVTSGYAGRKLVTGAGPLPFWALFALSVAGGAVGGLLLLHTSPKVFARLVPWLVLFATAVFTWGSFFRGGLRRRAGDTSADAGNPGPQSALHIGPAATASAQFLIAVYGGYFGGGIGILMMAALTMAGLSARHAGATKNVLAGVMNASAVIMFLASPELHWRQAVVLGAGAIIGGLLGAWALHRVNEKVLRLAIVGIGIALTIGLFLKPL